LYVSANQQCQNTEPNQRKHHLPALSFFSYTTRLPNSALRLQKHLLHLMTTTCCGLVSRSRKSRENILATNAATDFQEFRSILRPNETLELYNIQQHITCMQHITQAIIWDNICQLALAVKNWRILLEKSFTARMPLLTATSAVGLERRR